MSLQNGRHSANKQLGSVGTGSALLPFLQSSAQPLPSLNGADDRVAVAYIILAEATSEVLGAVSVSTLRRTGFGGAIYAVTDRPECIHPTAIPVAYNMSSIMPTRPLDAQWALQTPVKMRLLRLLTAWLHVPFLLYLDTDVFVTAPIVPFMRGASAHMLTKGSQLMLFRKDSGQNGLAFASDLGARAHCCPMAPRLTLSTTCYRTWLSE